MKTPDATEAVCNAIANAPGCVQEPNSLHHHYAKVAIAAYEEALAEQGYVILHEDRLMELHQMMRDE